ncbi:MAG TPA: nuclear transport factor 2 family protein [Pyrinomonadaceae bacterium]|nr:nuclear transport factor 2 family protein [Pyrinomonadaceae bacterium]
MKLFLPTTVCLLMAVLALAARETSVARQINIAEQELIGLSTELMKAVERKDRAVLEHLVSDEFTLESPGAAGEGVRKAIWIDNAVGMKWEDFEFHNFRVRFYGDTAVVTFLLDFKVTTGVGIPISSDAQITDVWVERNGRWQIAARHLGAYSLGGKVRIAAGFIAGLALWFLTWLIRKLRRRFAAKRRAAVI